MILPKPVTSKALYRFIVAVPPAVILPRLAVPASPATRLTVVLAFKAPVLNMLISPEPTMSIAFLLEVISPSSKPAFVALMLVPKLLDTAVVAMNFSPSVPTIVPFVKLLAPEPFRVKSLPFVFRVKVASLLAVRVRLEASAPPEVIAILLSLLAVKLALDR